MDYKKLRAINVNEWTEKKGQLTYLSWTFAVDQLLLNDPMATWEFPEPRTMPDETVMVFCKVTAFGKTIPMQLPVMDHKNNAIVKPDARKISDATMRCLAKCIACFGIGIYVYAGSDLPYEDDDAVIDALQALAESKGYDLQGLYDRLGVKSLHEMKPAQRKQLEQKLKESA